MSNSPENIGVAPTPLGSCQHVREEIPIQKNHLITIVAKRLEADPAHVKRIVNAMLSQIVENCRAGDECNLLGFGKFLPKLIQPLDMNGNGSPRFQFIFKPSGTAERRLNEGLGRAIRAAQAEARSRKARKRGRR